MTYLFSVDREIGVKGAESMRATEELSPNIKYISNSYFKGAYGLYDIKC